jgi:elongation factor P--(R)-beta-lysine ligase
MSLLTSREPQPTAWQPTATIDSLKFRAETLRRVRQFFDERSFIEVQTPCLLAETVVDAHLEPLRVGEFYLQTSPEAGMKRLLAAGAEAIYQMGPVFRADEAGQFHNLEFTMLEWYRCGDDMSAGIELLCQLVQRIVPELLIGTTTYRELLQDQLGFDPITASFETVRSCLAHFEPGYSLDDSRQETDPNANPKTEAELRDDYLDALMGLVIQPRLEGATVVSNYPITQAALARQSDSDPATAERFELFINGVEIANGYAELCDADELVRRTTLNNARRQHHGRAPLPAPECLIQAMRSGLPPCSGTALGFDRLVMVASGASHISQVLTFPLA